MKIVLINGESILLCNEKINSIVGDNKNVISFDMNGCSMEDVLLEAGYFSMFEEEKFIIIRNANFFGSGKVNEKDIEALLKYLDNPNPLSSMIFICNEKIDARKKITKKFKEKYEILINLLEQTNISLKQVMKIVGLVKEEEIKEITDKLIADLSLKEGYINGRPTNITIERIIG